MSRRILGYFVIVFALLFSTAQASLVPIEVKCQDADEKEVIYFGSGFVVGHIKDKSIVVTAGHLFERIEKINKIEVFGKEGKILFSRTKNVDGNLSGLEDIAIIEVDIKWNILWKLAEPKENEPVKPCGIVDNVILKINGITDEIGTNLIKECIVVEGMSGGPILALRDNKYVVVGLNVGSIKVMYVKENNTVRTIQTSLTVYYSGKNIREKLDEHAKGWEDE